MRPATRSWILTFACIVIVLTVGRPAAARTLWVDADSKAETADGSPQAAFKTITAAMQDVRPGDVVSVRAGV